MKVSSATEKIHKTKKKKIAWGDKIVINSNKSTISTKHKEETYNKPLKSILKGFQDEKNEVEKE